MMEFMEMKLVMMVFMKSTISFYLDLRLKIQKSLDISKILQEM